MSPRLVARWLWTFMAIGLVLRLVRYLLCFPLWEDECLLSANYLHRGYLELLRPLDYYQVCPPLFLWAQLSVTRLLGFSEYTLRLIPLLASVTSLVLFRHVAGRLFRGTALVAAVGLFAVSYPMARYAAEAKPYGCDLLISLIMLALVVEWLRDGRARWLWILAALVGPAVGFSYPAVFVAGGLSVVIAWRLWQTRTDSPLPLAGEGQGVRGDVGRGEPREAHPTASANPQAASPPSPFRLSSSHLAWLVMNLVLVASFVALMAVSRTAVGDATQQRMGDDWSHAFPPVTRPLELAVWLVNTHAGAMLGYPFGGPKGGSTLSLLAFLVGLVVLVRRRQGLLTALLLSPFALNFVAAAMQRYPYGGHVRLALFLAPAACLVLGLGIAEVVRWSVVGRVFQPVQKRLQRAMGGVRLLRGRAGKPVLPDNLALATVLLGMTLLAAGMIVRDVTHPYKSGTTLRAREFARWFWFDLAHDGELVCLKTDWPDEELSPGTFEWGWSALYLCNQRIYSPRHARGEPPHWDRVSADWPLRCVLFRSAKQERDGRALDRWRGQMETRYRLVAHDTYPVPAYDKRDRAPLDIDHIEVFKFVPAR